MRDMTELGFTSRPGPRELYVDLDGDRVPLPAEYIAFLNLNPPPSLELGFPFVNASGEQSEGYVQEFMSYSQETINKRILHTSEYPISLLPIGVDGGGNYLYLILKRGPMPVVDMDYGSGLLSTVAATFSDFLDLLFAFPL